MVLATFAFLVAATLTPSSSRIASDFCGALPSGTMERFVTLADQPYELIDEPFESVRDVVSHFGAVEISRCSVVAFSGSRITLDVVGSGLTRNEFRRREPLPQRWYLTLAPSGKLDSAQDEARYATERLVDAADDRERAVVLNAMSVPLEDIARNLVKGQKGKATDTALFLLSWGAQHHDAETEAYAYCALGEIARREGSRDEAARRFDLAIDTANASASCDASAYANYLAGNNATNPERKYAFLSRAAAELSSLREPYPALLALNQLRVMAADDLASASRYLDALENFANEYENVEARILTDTGRASMAQGIGDRDRTRELLRRVIVVAHRVGDAESESKAWANIGQSFSDASDYEPAIDAFRHALTMIDHRGPSLVRSYSSSWLGLNLVHERRTDEASRYVNAAFELPSDARAWNHVFPYFFLENLRRSEGRCQESIDAAREAIRIDPANLSMIWAIQADLGETLADSGDLDGAVEAYRAAIDLVESRRAASTSSSAVRTRHFATRVWVYQRLEKVLLDSHRVEEALEVAEQIKARSLLDSIDGDSDQLPLTAAERKQHERLNQAVLDANTAVMKSHGAEEIEAHKKLHAARTALDTFREDMALHYANRAESGGAVDPMLLTRKRDVAVVEYATLPDGMVAYVIRNGRITARPVSTPAAVEPIIRKLREEVLSGDLRTAEESERLYDALWRPVEDLLPRTSEIVIVPDGVLWEVPFAALRNRQNQFLIEKHPISYAPSITLLDRTARRRKRTASHELLALGNPHIEGSTRKQAATYRGLSLGPLPDAETEVRSIANLYGANRTKVLIGRAATESALREAAGAYRVIHLATHGILDSESPLYSALVLSRRASDHDDGLLEMREMTHLHLNADLVVLSACDTGTGEIYPGEGVIGMSWAMLGAGCSRVVVSQWKADSRATSELMISFHRSLRKGKSAAEALRQAELALMKDSRYEHPLYWAPFIVVGAAGH